MAGRPGLDLGESGIVHDTSFAQYLGGESYSPHSVSIETFKKMLHEDAQVNSNFNILVLSVLAKGYDVTWDDTTVPVSRRDDVIDCVWRSLKEVNTTEQRAGGLHTWIKQMMSAIWAGISVSEIVWTYDKTTGWVAVRKLKCLDEDNIDIYPDPYGNLKSVSQRTSAKGTIDLPIERLIIWSYNAEYGEWRGWSDFHHIYKDWYIKDYLIKFRNIFLERFGNPLILAKTKSNKKSLDAVVKAARVSSRIVTNLEDDIQLLTDRRSGAAGTQFDKAILYHDKMIALGLLVPTLIMSQESTGARALGDVHYSGVFNLRVSSLQREIESIMDNLIKKVVIYNFGEQETYPHFNFGIFQERDIKAMGGMVKVLIEGGVVAPTEAWIREWLGIPPPTEEDQQFLDEQGGPPEVPGEEPGTTPPSPEEEPGEEPEKAKYSCECIKCGKKVSSDKHCKDIKCPKCGGDMRRTERPGPGRSKELMDEEVTKEKDHVGEWAEVGQDLAWKEKFKDTDLFLRQHEISLERDVRRYFDKVFEDITVIVGDILSTGRRDDGVRYSEFDYTILNQLDEFTNDPELAGKIYGIQSVVMTQAIDEAYDKLLAMGFDVTSIYPEDALLWFENYAFHSAGVINDDILQQAKQTVFSGMQAGLSNRDIVKELRKTFTTFSNQRLNNIVRTNVMNSFNAGRAELFKGNSDFVKGVEFVATLDQRTSRYCEEHHGQQVPLSRADEIRPPCHFQCRSLLLPILLGDKVDYRWTETNPRLEGF